MSKKKLLFFHHSGTVGGAGISGLNCLNSISKEKYDITVYTVSNPDNMIRIFYENGYRVIEGGNTPVSFIHCVGSKRCALSPHAIVNYIKVKKNEACIEKVIIDEKPDVVVVNSMTLFWIGKIAKKHGTETVCFFRETYIRGVLGVRTSYIKRNLSKYFDKIAFISNYELVRSKKIKSDKVTIYNMVNPNGYDKYSKDEARRVLSLAKNDFYVLFVGGTSRLKGTLVLLRALSRILDPKIKVLFVGSTLEQIKKNAYPTDIKRRLKNVFVKNYSRKCLECIEKNKLLDKIVFFPSQSDIAPFYCAADLLVFPMTAPHQARPLFEAGYAKIPVVITDFENIKEFVDPESGYLFKNHDDRHLAEIIKNIKSDPDAAYGKVKINYKNTMSRHSPDIYKKQIEDFLDG